VSTEHEAPVALHAATHWFSKQFSEQQSELLVQASPSPPKRQTNVRKTWHRLSVHPPLQHWSLVEQFEPLGRQLVHVPLALLQCVFVPQQTVELLVEEHALPAARHPH
jgi:hypothetical protein